MYFYQNYCLLLVNEVGDKSGLSLKLSKLNKNYYRQQRIKYEIYDKIHII